jgi:nitronate monooxygenase
MGDGVQPDVWAEPAAVMLSFGTRDGRSTLPFVPAVVDLVAPVPVLAAGGIADGRGLAAALVLGASGALIGTRFQATQEAVVDPEIKKAIVDGRGEETERSSGELLPQPAWAGEAVDLISDLPSAADLVATLVREAEQALAAFR